MQPKMDTSLQFNPARGMSIHIVIDIAAARRLPRNKMGNCLEFGELRVLWDVGLRRPPLCGGRASLWRAGQCGVGWAWYCSCGLDSGGELEAGGMSSDGAFHGATRGSGQVIITLPRYEKISGHPSVPAARGCTSPLPKKCPVQFWLELLDEKSHFILPDMMELDSKSRWTKHVARPSWLSKEAVGPVHLQNRGKSRLSSQLGRKLITAGGGKSLGNFRVRRNYTNPTGKAQNIVAENPGKIPWRNNV
ncbi:hypothetical protein C8R43DRAFT_952736 [Mycena crocata]|nr:hypothetical protein C8R43DRAFT_952736 [Mycena crocata]